MAQIKSGRVYLWIDKKNRRFYIGAKFCIDSAFKNYLCSNENLKSEYAKRPQDFTRVILEDEIPSVDMTSVLEAYWLSGIPKEALGNMFYNLCNYNKVSKDRCGFKGDMHTRPDSWREAISKTCKGKQFSDDTRKKLSERKVGSNNPMYGRKHSEESKRIMSEKQKAFRNAV